MKEGEVLIFEEKDYPAIKLYSNRVEVKDRGYWEFRIFYFKDLKKMQLKSPVTFSNTGLIIELMFWLTKDKGPSSIKFWKTNKDTWWYEMPSAPSDEFLQFYKLMEQELRAWREGLL